MTTIPNTIDATLIVDEYIESINASYHSGEATEHTYRNALSLLLDRLLNVSKKHTAKDYITIINEPKRRDYGAPDFLLKRNELAISFLETKQPGDSDLRGERVSEHKNQFDKYKQALHTIATTDFLRFVLFEDAEEITSAQLAEITDKGIIASYDETQLRQFLMIVQHLGDATPQPIRNARRLAILMAAKAKLIAEILLRAMEIGEELEDKELLHKLSVFRDFLVHDMSEEQFADFYAQTIIYGMFIARAADPTSHTFTLQDASDLIPSFNPFLKKIFKLLALADLHSKVKWIVEDLVEIFRVTDMVRVMRNYHKDPLVHFYEDFLEEYNPEIRDAFGVWYTPEPIVQFIVDAVDTILKEDFRITEGLADNSLLEKSEHAHKVQILDPATGTGTFLAKTVERIYDNYKGQEGLWAEDVVNHIIPRLNGFEYLMAPYTMAHLKIATALRLDENPQELPSRLNIFLTNSLDEDSPHPNLPFAQFITDESNAAGHIKRETPVMVVMGNPPYNEKSANNGEWIMDLMDDYKQEPGQGPIFVRKSRKGINIFKNSLKGGNPKGLNNDYCKFIRLGQNFVERNEEGVLAYITANTYLDSRLFRGMRYELLKAFETIYIINLHGSTMRQESTAEQVDQCVFKIRQGVAIAIFVKTKSKINGQLARVFYKDMYGRSGDKLKYLKEHSLTGIDFLELSPVSPLYTFRPVESALRLHYEDGFSVEALMKKYVQGFKSDRDSVAIHHDRLTLQTLINDLRSSKTEEELRHQYNIKDNRDWKLEKARKSLRKNKQWEDSIIQVQFRPFDVRWTFYKKELITYPRPLLQESVLGHNNNVLCIGQQGNVIGKSEWSLVYISSLPVDLNIVPRGGIYLFPLYLYDGMKRTINLSQLILDELERRTGLKLWADAPTETYGVETEEMVMRRKKGYFMPQEMVDYIYALLHSTKYRETYHDFLQNDFPVIPYPSSACYFFLMASYGCKLRRLHQLKDITKEEIITKFPRTGQVDNNVVCFRRFNSTEDGKGQVWINDQQYFDNVPSDCWEKIIAGYQVLDKWLKDRIGKKLSNDEILCYQKIIVALHRTIAIQKEIDESIRL